MDEEYVRVSGDVVCSICGDIYYNHPREKKFDAWEGQEMELLRGCDGRLMKP